MLGLAVLLPNGLAAGSPNIVISQVYAAGGNNGATYQNDFIELFNRSSCPVKIDGWSVQYAQSTSSSWDVTPLSGTIPPGGYYLVQEASHAPNDGAALPTPDATGTISLRNGGGKVVLKNDAIALTCNCSAGVIDLIGYGNADWREGSTASDNAPELSDTTANLRAGGGCTDTDSNAANFKAGTPTPRNSASSTAPCLAVRYADAGAKGVDDGKEYPEGSCHYVGTDVFAKLQDAVNATPPGGTVHVAAGMYPEYVEILTPMTLLGANAGIDPRDPACGGGVRVAETIIDGMGIETAIAFKSSGITLDGFTVRNGGGVDVVYSLYSGLHMGNFHDDNHVLNNIFTNNQFGVWANCAGPLPTEIRRNVFDANDLPNPPSTPVGAGLSADGSVNLRVIDNEFRRHTTVNPINFQATGPGAHIGLFVDGNNLHDNNCGCSAMYVLGVTNGVFSRNQIASPATGLRLASANNGVTIRSNIFSSGTVGVRLLDDGYGYPANTNIHINANSFGALSAFAVSREAGNNGSDSDTILDASGNWWGVNTLAGVQGKLDITDGLIDFTPWLDTGVEPVPNLCDGFQGNFSTLHVDDASPQSGTLGRIQEAINLVSASTILIGPGNYVENDVIGPALAVNLIGAGSGTVPATDTIITAANAALPVILIDDVGGSGVGSELTIKNLRVTGSTGADGIRVQATSALRSFYKFDNVAAVSNPNGAGIGLQGPNDLSDVTVNGCLLDGNNTGLRLATSIHQFRRLSVTGGKIQNNNTAGLGINGSGTDATDPNTDYSDITVDGTQFADNDTGLFAGGGHLSFFRFNGNATIKNIAVGSPGTELEFAL